MLHDNICISHSMVHSQQVEETALKRKNREFTRDKSYKGGTSKCRLQIQGKPRLKNIVSNKIPSNLSNDNKDRVSNPNS